MHANNSSGLEFCSVSHHIVAVEEVLKDILQNPTATVFKHKQDGRWW